MAKGIMLCSQHIVLVIQMEFPPKHYQVSLLLTRKEKLPKCQEIPVISAVGKKHFPSCPLWMLFKKIIIPKLTSSNRLPGQEEVFQKLFSHQNDRFCFTGNSQVSHLFSLGLHLLPSTETKTNKQKYSRKVLTQEPKQEKRCLPL